MDLKQVIAQLELALTPAQLAQVAEGLAEGLGMLVKVPQTKLPTLNIQVQLTTHGDNRLGTELIALREAHGDVQAKVAKAMQWSASKLSRIEGGHVTIDYLGLKALLDYYQVTDERERARLIALAESIRKEMRRQAQQVRKSK